MQRQAVHELAWQGLQVIVQPVRSAAWHDVPTTDLVCSPDRGTLAERQREYARRARTVVEMATGHHPFLAQPAAVRDLIVGLS